VHFETLFRFSSQDINEWPVRMSWLSNALFVSHCDKALVSPAMGHWDTDPLDFRLIFQVTSERCKLWHSTLRGFLHSRNPA